MPATRTHYELLGVERDASPEQIKAAYRQVAKTLHPDLPTGNAALFGMVNEAHQVLSDPKRRQKYDMDTFGFGSSSSPSGASSSFTRSSGSSGSSGSRPGAQSNNSAGPPSGGGSASDASDARDASDAAGGFRASNQHATSSPGPRTQEPAMSAAPTGRGQQLAWWTFPLIVTVAVGFGLLRFTGITATWFGAMRGQQILGGDWRGVPELMTGGIAGLMQSLVLVAALCGGLTATFVARKHQAPTPRTEKLLLLVALATLASSAEFILVSGRAWLVLTGLVVAYGAWVWLLKNLPTPASSAEWESFSVWLRALMARRRGSETAAPAAGTDGGSRPTRSSLRDLLQKRWEARQKAGSSSR
jgi:curved DNA-binding protein CbpA